ncbi:MAG: carboxypeptidase-like regulatory domain-containing protein, partial [Bacteroidetes bacterium]|nr:carboxypeptidase-like regulatory domain-containing protein [Bacteroidota bacterium]
MRKIVSMLSLLLLAGLLVMAQTRQITGRVTDEKGNPIPFSTITEKGTKNGVAADANGEFVIKVKSGTVLVISSSGFDDKEVSIQGVSKVTVQLSGTMRTMDEVIVTAGGIKTKRKELGTTTTLVSQEALTSGKPTNIANGLQGRVAG